MQFVGPGVDPDHTKSKLAFLLSVTGAIGIRLLLLYALVCVQACMRA